MNSGGRPNVLLIGGGPAGLSAVLWCAELGIDATLIEREPELGGQLHRIYGPITNYLGLRTDNGAEMLAHFLAAIEHASTRRITGVELVEITPVSSEARLSNGERIQYSALVIATGVRRRSLNVPGEIEFKGKGVIDSGTRDAELAKGRNVVVVGGGDAAVENAFIVSKVAKKVTIVHRREQFSARPDLVESLRSRGNIEIVWNSVVEGIDGVDQVSSVIAKDLESGTRIRIDADFVLVRIGVEPNTEVFADLVALDERGYVIVDAHGMTSRPNIFAVGDVANSLSPTLSTAVGTGTTAIKMIYELFCKPGK